MIFNQENCIKITAIDVRNGDTKANFSIPKTTPIYVMINAIQKRYSLASVSLFSDNVKMDDTLLCGMLDGTDVTFLGW